MLNRVLDINQRIAARRCLSAQTWTSARSWAHGVDGARGVEVLRLRLPTASRPTPRPRAPPTCSASGFLGRSVLASWTRRRDELNPVCQSKDGGDRRHRYHCSHPEQEVWSPVIHDRILELAGPLRVITFLTAAVLMAATFTLSASPAMASASACGGGGFNNPYYAVCTDVNGAGLHINSLSGQFFNHYVDTGVKGVHIQLYGPMGTIKNCPEVNVGRQSHGPKCIWSPNRNEPAGNYCSRAWERLSATNFRQLALVCITVHR